MLQSLINNHAIPSAICAATDSLAMGLMNGLIKLGFSIPKDISIIGIDNVSASASPLVQLTTVGVADQSQLGDIAIRQLINRIENQNNHDSYEEISEDIRITKPVSLFERRTTRKV